MSESLNVNQPSETAKQIEQLIKDLEFQKAAEAISELNFSEVTPQDQVLLWHFHGVALFRLGRTAESVHKFHQSLEAAQTIGDVTGQARAFEQLGTIQHNEARLDESLVNYDKALRLWRSINDIEGQGRGFRNLANVRVDQNKADEALALYDKSREFFRQAQLPNEMAPAIIHSASLRYQKQGIAAAIAVYKAGVEQDKCQHYLVLNNYGFLLMLQGNMGEGLSLITDALADIQAKNVNDDDLALVYLNLGVGYALQQQLDKGADYLRKAAAILEKYPDARAVEFLLQANDAYREQGFHPYLVVDNGQKHSLAHLNLATVLAWAGKLDEAEKEAEIGIDLDRSSSYPYLSAGWIYLLKGDEKKAVSAFNRACRSEPSNEEFRKALNLVNPYISAKVGRNEPCPCGSGKKFKKCHGAI